MKKWMKSVSNGKKRKFQNFQFKVGRASRFGSLSGSVPARAGFGPSCKQLAIARRKINGALFVRSCSSFLPFMLSAVS